MKPARYLVDRLFDKLMPIVSGLIWALLLWMLVGLIVKSYDIVKISQAGELFGASEWRPSAGKFGFLSFIAGTLWVTLLSVVLAVPFCLLVGIYLSEYAHSRFRNFFRPIIDLLAGIPSVIYGLWGVIMIIPFIKNRLAPAFQINTTGFSVLAGGIVLAVMISPVLINITYEVLQSIPRNIRESSLALGATKWQSVKVIVFERGLSGILAGIVLALSRAFGETMAVLMVTGNVAKIPESLFDPAYTLPALIANGYGEMMSVPLYQSALLYAALILMFIIFVFNLISRWVLIKIEERYQ